jgi:glycosyl transferase family 87
MLPQAEQASVFRHSRFAASALVVAALIALLRFGVALHLAPPAAQGDFRATLPGAYAKTLNPRLWNSPDLRGSYGYQREIYVYGPTQYLVLYPIVFLNSYAQISRVLYPVYAGVLMCSLLLVSRLMVGRERSYEALLLITALALLFPPFYQALIQKEFETVVFFGLVAATYLLVRKKENAAAILLGVITWFKLWPITFLGYFIVKRKLRAAAVFVLASCVMLGIAQVLFGLDRFVIFNPAISANVLHGPFILTSLSTSGHATSIFADGEWRGSGFCKNWHETEQTAVAVQWAFCRLTFAHPWIPTRLLFYGLSVLAGLAGFFALSQLDRKVLPDDVRRFSIAVEVSLVTVASAFVLSAHYYYFIYMVLPVGVLAWRYVGERHWVRVGWLAMSYCLLAGFLLPVSATSRLLGVDFWRFYIEHVIYLYGELILIALLLYEYVALGLRYRGAQACAPASEVVR